MSVVGSGVGNLIAGIGVLIAVRTMMCGRPLAARRFTVAGVMISIGIATPSVIQLMFNAAVATNLFN